MIPCPFCSKPDKGPVLTTWKGDWGTWSAQAHCLDCRVTIEHSAFTEKEAEAALLGHWNARSTHPCPTCQSAAQESKQWRDAATTFRQTSESLAKQNEELRIRLGQMEADMVTCQDRAYFLGWTQAKKESTP